MALHKWLETEQGVVKNLFFFNKYLQHTNIYLHKEIITDSIEALTTMAVR